MSLKTICTVLSRIKSKSNDVHVLWVSISYTKFSAYELKHYIRLFAINARWVGALTEKAPPIQKSDTILPSKKLLTWKLQDHIDFYPRRWSGTPTLRGKERQLPLPSAKRAGGKNETLSQMASTNADLATLLLKGHLQAHVNVHLSFPMKGNLTTL